MESTNRTSFTITQPFLGAPLQFNPALGSKELEEMVDMYVIGNGPKNEKLSVVTVEFFNLATVDLNTGALTRTYEIFPFINFEQSPMQSQSSGFSPPIFTPSPASSATFGDSGYGSFSFPSMTPPTRTLGAARVTKKVAKKDTKKAKVDEARLPGFSIMTKDGIDVTTTAGRGTKTKEQREHAHLMRIMKACDACKKKKIRCDPSHRRSTEMSRTSTTTPQASTGSAHISPQYESSPSSSAPALSRQSTQISQSPAAFTPTNPMEDFVLFPEDASWNPDMSETDLGNFNFDINELDFNAADFPVQNFSFYQQPFNNGDLTFDHRLGLSFQEQQPYSQISPQQSYTAFSRSSDSYDTPGDSFDTKQGLPVSHTRPHPSSQSQDSDQIESSLRSSSHSSRSLQDLDQRESSLRSDPSKTTRDSDQIESSRQNLSVHSMSQHANESVLSTMSDWNALESSLGLSSQTLSSTGPASLQKERVKSSLSILISGSIPNADANANARNSSGDIAANATIDGSATVATNAVIANSAVIAENTPGLVSIMQYQSTTNINNASGGALVTGSGAIISVGPSDPLDVPLQSQRPAVSRSTILRELNKSCLQVSQSLQTIKSSRSEYTGLNTDLQRLHSVLQILQTREGTIVSEGVLEEIQAIQSQLSKLSSLISSSDTRSQISNPLLLTLDPVYAPELFRQCQISARRLVRSLCATINTVQAHNTGTHVAVTQIATSGRSISEGSRVSPLSGTSMPAYGSQNALASSSEAGMFFYRTALLQVCKTRRSMVLAGVVLAVIAVAVLSSMVDGSLIFTSLMQGVQYMTASKETCDSWIGNTARLALFALMAAQLPIPTKSRTSSEGLTPFSFVTFVTNSRMMSTRMWMSRISSSNS